MVVAAVAARLVHHCSAWAAVVEAHPVHHCSAWAVVEAVAAAARQRTWKASEAAAAAAVAAAPREQRTARAVVVELPLPVLVVVEALTALTAVPVPAQEPEAAAVVPVVLVPGPRCASVVLAVEALLVKREVEVPAHAGVLAAAEKPRRVPEAPEDPGWLARVVQRVNRQRAAARRSDGCLRCRREQSWVAVAAEPGPAGERTAPVVKKVLYGRTCRHRRAAEARKSAAGGVVAEKGRVQVRRQWGRDVGRPCPSDGEQAAVAA